ncbi:MAG: hypothetical protein M1839_007167 [Geoglossum umbratile]|nr:MAG: hypothetical protein M1839_007167 [Geoglossum umbratile]
MPGSVPQCVQNGRYSLSVLWKLKDRLLSTCAAADYTQTYAEDRASGKEQARDESTASMRIHIVGIGGVGKLVAHSLKAMPSPPPVTLVLHKPHLVDLWKERGRGIVIENQTSRIGYMQRGYDIELVCRPTHPPSTSTTAWNGGDSERQRDRPGKGIIRHLIVATSDPATVAAVASVKDRLCSESTILLLQAGMGLVEEINEKLFPDRETRPNYMLGVTSHKLYPLGGFRAHHTGTGTTALCMLSDGSSTGYWAPTSRYLMSTLTRIPVLAAAGFPEAQLKQMKLERLAVDAVVGPLTTLFNCYSGDLLHNFAINNVIRKLVSEISPILLSLPELRGLPNTNKRFSPRRLSKLILVTLATVSRNVSPMLRDVRAGRETGIDYANGYISRRARELGLKCDFNDMVIEMVKGKQQLLSRQRDDYISIE